MKAYTKPVMVMEKIEVNQAIAKCSAGRKGLTVHGQAFGCVAWGGAPNYYSKGYVGDAEFQAGEQQQHSGCTNEKAHVILWDVWGPRQDGSYGHVAYYEDTNGNGVLDEGTTEDWQIAQAEGMDHWQSVESIKNTTGIFMS